MNKHEYPSMETAYEWGRKAPELLSAEASALDTKAMGVFTSASLLIGVLSAVSQGLKVDCSLIPFVLSFVSFLIAAGLSFKALWVCKMAVADDPEYVRTTYWKLEPAEAMLKNWQETVKAYNKNLKVVRSKGTALRYALPALATEVAFLLVWLLLTSY